MNSNSTSSEKNFTVALIAALAVNNDVPTRVEVEKKAGELANIFQYPGDLESVVENTMIAIDTRMGMGVSLIDEEATHDEDWVRKREDLHWTYSNVYESFLKEEGWPPKVVQSLSDVGSRILGHLQDPLSEGESNRRGLVIGHVQSGKTANYISVVAKAADSGYKFIIVVAGIHNNLRKQTQERIDEGFVGRSSDPEFRSKSIGVGLIHKHPHPVTLTNIYSDFNKKIAAQSGWQLNDFSKPIVLVIKKNVSTLQALHDWLREMNAQGGRIADVPMLMIDDEADNASINTNKEDLDPTRTNKLIRKILRLFMKSCYVGYTATPFANIFINPNSYDDEVREELFPRDFIYCLDAPNTYFGPDKVFLNDDLDSTNVLKPITDCEDYLPFKHKKEHALSGCPPSLYVAIIQFVLVRVIRNLRKQKNKHCSMMINVSRFVGIQKEVRDIVSTYVNELRQAVKANYARPEHIANRNSFMRNLQKVYLEEYSDSGFEWPEIKSALLESCESIRIFTINSQSDETLDYKRYEKDGEALTAIAVGGLSLSRGLTIEGLSISYMYRNTRMYDTLMQMGRWFGYRPGYEDLCRIHLAIDSIDWYAHIAEVSEELRQQIKWMRRDRLSPKQFGLYVRAHPSRLLVTALNKMHAGEKITMSMNFNGRLIESYCLPVDAGINMENESLIEKYWRQGFGTTLDKTKKGWFAENVAISTIEKVLLEFQTHPDFNEQKNFVVQYIQKVSEHYPKGDVLLISLEENEQDESRFRLGYQNRSSATRKNGAWRTSKNRVASRGDEKLGLTKEQIQRAENIVKKDAGTEKPSDIHYRMVRQKPLLMIHVLNLTGSNGEENRVPAFGISLPFGDYVTQIEVVANTVWIDRMHAEPIDESSDDEE